MKIIKRIIVLATFNEMLPIFIELQCVRVTDDDFKSFSSSKHNICKLKSVIKKINQLFFSKILYNFSSLTRGSVMNFVVAPTATVDIIMTGFSLPWNARAVST